MTETKMKKIFVEADQQKAMLDQLKQMSEVAHEHSGKENHIVMVLIEHDPETDQGVTIQTMSDIESMPETLKVLRMAMLSITHEASEAMREAQEAGTKH